MFKRAALEQMATILGGVLIWRAAPQGAAARYGVRAGDIVLSVNGMATPNLAAFERARRLRRDGAQLSLYRFGRALEIDVPFADSDRGAEREAVERSLRRSTAVSRPHA